MQPMSASEFHSNLAAVTSLREYESLKETAASGRATADLDHAEKKRRGPRPTGPWIKGRSAPP